MNELLVAHLYLFLLAAFGVLEALLGQWPRTDGNETSLDIASIVVTMVIRPIVFIAVFFAAQALIPSHRGALSDLPWPARLAVYLPGEDMPQYWWHRLGHTKFGWPWHRATIPRPTWARITFRNGMLYSFFTPNIWTGALFISLGAGVFAITYSTVKQLVVIAAHSEIRWDEWLYRSPRLRPLAWIVERTLSTPATHFAHHALREGEGVGHYSGNFGNLLFFWDMLFGAALITRKYPPAFGVESDLFHGREPWSVQLFFPLFRSPRPDSDYADRLFWFRRKETTRIAPAQREPVA